LEIEYWLDKGEIGGFGEMDDRVDMVPGYARVAGEPATDAVGSGVDGVVAVDGGPEIHDGVKETEGEV
jgi:hypothetical protein